MTIIVFLIDTSASMFQRTYVGGRTTILDVAKSAVETFVKLRQRSADSRVDRYMLLTFEDPPNNVKAGWKENLATFMNELKNLQCYSMTTMGVAVKQSFDILNVNRMTTGIDTYGQGRCPFFLETSMIVLITDGGKLSTVNGVHEDFNLPMNNHIPGAEMTREPFRWDQRLFALVLRLTGTPAVERDAGLVSSDSSPIDAMCEVTGGRSYSITSQRMLNQCIDSLVQKVANGVVINFEMIGPDPPRVNDRGEEQDDGVGIVMGEFADTVTPTAAALTNTLANTPVRSCRKMIYVPRMHKYPPMFHWPIPESFWPEVTASVLPPRTAHPNVKFTCTSSDPMVIENFPFDKYELEPSPLTQYILARKQPTICWQVFVANSYKNTEVGHPFGYLKASSNLIAVNLFVMPYNYPVLLPLLDELSKVHRMKPSNEWRNQFQNYMRTLPAYYACPLRRALRRMGVPLILAQQLIPEAAETCLSYSVINYLKKLKNQACVEYDKTCTDILQRLQSGIAHKTQFNTPEQIRLVPKVLIKKELISHPLLHDKFGAQKEQLADHGTLYIGIMDRERNTSSFRNPFDIPRRMLMQQVARMRNNFFQSDFVMQDEDSAHALPIAQMGNYQEYLKRQTPQLRELESTPVRQHMFGNPFKIDKRMMVDEADIDLVGSPTGGAKGGVSPKRPNAVSAEVASRVPAKRKPGPLPRDLVVRRPSGVDTPPASPVHIPMSPMTWPHEVPSLPEETLPPASPIVANNSHAMMNGNDTSHAPDRPRSPSPPFDMLHLNNIGGYPSPANEHNDLYYPNFAPDDKQQISQILKEANSMVNNNNSVQSTNNSVVNNNGIVLNEKVSAEAKQEIESANIETRKVLNRLVRRPGKNYTNLFDTLKTLRGNAEAQQNVIKLVIEESLRFKRAHLANLLEQHMQSIMAAENKCQ